MRTAGTPGTPVRASKRRRNMGVVGSKSPVQATTRAPSPLGVRSRRGSRAYRGSAGWGPGETAATEPCVGRVDDQHGRSVSRDVPGHDRERSVAGMKAHPRGRGPAPGARRYRPRGSVSKKMTMPFSSPVLTVPPSGLRAIEKNRQALLLRTPSTAGSRRYTESSLERSLRGESVQRDVGAGEGEAPDRAGARRGPQPPMCWAASVGGRAASAVALGDRDNPGRSKRRSAPRRRRQARRRAPIGAEMALGLFIDRRLALIKILAQKPIERPRTKSAEQ